ncbi:MAG: type I polyketide synthase, partial [Verrucomicrobiota bacterium]
MTFYVHSEPPSGSDAGAGVEEVILTLRRFLADELCMAEDEVADDISFIEMGLDSISSVTWVRKINTLYGLSMTATTIYKYPTLREFSDYVLGRLGDASPASTPPPPEPPVAAAPPVESVPVPVTETKSNGSDNGDRFLPVITSRRKNRRSSPSREPEVRQPEPKTTQRPAVAVIGMAGQFPGAEHLDRFWENIAEGRNGISDVPAERWPMDRYYDPEPGVPGKSNSRWMGVLEDVDAFDPLFFNIAPMEAEVMDPQQRLFLQSCWRCLEDAGYPPSSLSGEACGVFAGCAPNSYRNLLRGDHRVAQGGLGIDSSILPGRVSYLFNLRGPSMAIDTACSASLVAVAHACDSLALGNCDLALTGGAWVIPGPDVHIMMSQTGALSPDGRCFVFDQRANGFVPGEGVGVVLLKRLDDAIRDNDRIQGVIAGWGTNQDGRTNGMTAPNEAAQAALQEDIYRKFSINPDEIQLIEAHGTGTRLGDPIEIEALKTSFGPFTKNEGTCALGSVKSNIGHLAPAAGIAGLLKALLALRHRTLPPTIHYESLNEHIDLEGSPFYINQEVRDWAVPEGVKRRAAVNSFGFAGTNAHVVVEEAERPAVRPDAGGDHAVVLSARNEERLKELVSNLAAFLDRESVRLADVAYTLQVGREAMEERLGMVVGSIEELKEKLRVFVEGRDDAAFCRSRIKPEEQDHACIDSGSAGALLDAWMSGRKVDWKKTHGDQPPRRIGLPTYPFAKERYWVEPVEEDMVPASKEEPTDVMAFEEVWSEQALSAAGSATTKTMVCFLSGKEEQQTWDNVVHKQNPDAKTIFVAEGRGGRTRSALKYSISRTNPASYEKTLSAIREDHGEVDALLYLWPLEEEDRIRDYAPVVQLLQAMMTSELNPKRVVLAGSFEDGLERCYLESWIGFERSLGMMLSEVELATVFRAGSSPMTTWASTLWAELQAEQLVHAFYRDDTRHVRTVRPVALEDNGLQPLKTGGTYLITGGCGGLGGVLAEHLAANYSAHLILTGRSALTPEKQAWLDGLEQTVYLQVDVADAEAMKQALNNRGPIHGVFHAAGIEAGPSLFEKTAEDFGQVLRPKVQGSLVLAEVLVGEPLDFFCHFSSSSALLGDFGACDYAVANRFQMLHADWWNESSCPGRAIAINWPLWKDGGMGGDADQTRFYLTSSGQRFLEAAEGIALVEQLLTQPRTRHLILAGRPERIHRFLGLSQADPVDGDEADVEERVE